MESTSELARYDAIRYRGHISLEELGVQGQKALCDARVLIVGAGGLGSPVALYLAAAGVGHIGIVDDDTVQLSNLQRQIAHTDAACGCLKVDSVAQRMHEINPKVEVRTYPVRLTRENAIEIFSRYDIVADCTDSAASRCLISRLCEEMSMPCAYAAVSRFAGQIFTYLPGTASFVDIFGEGSADFWSGSSAEEGILNTAVGIAGCLQATEIIKFVTGVGVLLTNQLLTFNALTMDFKIHSLV